MITALHCEIFLIALLTAIACSLSGTFLVLREVALMSDAISHAVVLGIAIMFLLIKTLESPLLFIGASCAGIFMVIGAERLIKTKKVKKDAAIGLIFPLFFSVGVIIISRYARNIHLDVDMVLLGEIVFAPFNRMIIYGVDYGSYALWTMGSVVLFNSICIGLLYKEFVFIIFDPVQALLTRFSPLCLYYIMMIMASITAVAAFSVVGSIMVVALMIAPAATAYLLTRRVSQMIAISLVIAMLSTLFGYIAAAWFDVSVAGSIVSVAGLFFIGAFIRRVI